MEGGRDEAQKGALHAPTRRRTVIVLHGARHAFNITASQTPPPSEARMLPHPAAPARATFRFAAAELLLRQALRVCKHTHTPATCSVLSARWGPACLSRRAGRGEGLWLAAGGGCHENERGGDTCTRLAGPAAARRA